MKIIKLIGCSDNAYSKPEVCKFSGENGAWFAQYIEENGLWNHLVATDKRANELEDMLKEQMSNDVGITEALKREDAMTRITRRNGLKNWVREIVYNECIYV